MIEAGTILQERYRVEKQIGQGGMGTVFVAVDQRFGSKVAIKETFFEDDNLKKAFEREARLLNSLKHPALPKVNDFFSEDDTQFIVMEYIAGEDLSTILEKTGEAFAVEDVLDWGEQLCDALEYLHSQTTPVIHRDIKPQNLKLTPTGQIILLDFGLAKGNPTDASHHTAAKSIFGYSRNYASLEQMQGTGTDPQSDLYSLAATLYHLASGVPPADALTRAMNVLNAQSDPLVPANLVDANIPRGVAEVLQKTMALNAAERPATAREFRSMLADCDKSIVPAAALTNANALAETDLLQQETKLMSAATNVQDVGTENINTEVLPGNLADDKTLATKVAEKDRTTQEDESTKVIGAVAGGSGFGGRTFAAVGGLILFAFAAIFGVYLLDSQDSAGSNEIPKVETKFAPANAESANANVILSETDFPATEEETSETQNPMLVEEVPTEKADKEIDKPAKTTEKAEKKKVSSGRSETTATASSDGTGRFVVEEDGKKIIVDGKRIEMDDMIIEDDKVFMKDKATGKKIYVKPPFPPEDLKRMTPEQLRRLKAMEKARLEQVRREKMRRQNRKQPPPPEPRPRLDKPPTN